MEGSNLYFGNHLSDQFVKIFHACFSNDPYGNFRLNERVHFLKNLSFFFTAQSRKILYDNSLISTVRGHDRSYDLYRVVIELF